MIIIHAGLSGKRFAFSLLFLLLIILNTSNMFILFLLYSHLFPLSLSFNHSITSLTLTLQTLEYSGLLFLTFKVREKYDRCKRLDDWPIDYRLAFSIVSKHYRIG